tara:strand:+ start:329 stop:463 length:135 start_codon:yes stop_codon:yes gene_type:complete
MLRLLVLIFLLYGIGVGLKDGWLKIQWNQLLNDVGVTEVEKDKK